MRPSSVLHVKGALRCGKELGKRHDFDSVVGFGRGISLIDENAPLDSRQIANGAESREYVVGIAGAGLRFDRNEAFAEAKQQRCRGLEFVCHNNSPLGSP